MFVWTILLFYLCLLSLLQPGRIPKETDHKERRDTDIAAWVLRLPEKESGKRVHPAPEAVSGKGVWIICRFRGFSRFFISVSHAYAWKKDASGIESFYSLPAYSQIESL